MNNIHYTALHAASSDAGTFMKNSQPRHVNKTSNHETQWSFRYLDQIALVDEWFACVLCPGDRSRRGRLCFWTIEVWHIEL